MEMIEMMICIRSNNQFDHVSSSFLSLNILLLIRLRCLRKNAKKTEKRLERKAKK